MTSLITSVVPLFAPSDSEFFRTTSFYSLLWPFLRNVRFLWRIYSHFLADEDIFEIVSFSEFGKSTIAFMLRSAFRVVFHSHRTVQKPHYNISASSHRLVVAFLPRKMAFEQKVKSDIAWKRIIISRRFKNKKTNKWRTRQESKLNLIPRLTRSSFIRFCDLPNIAKVAKDL